MDVLATDLPEVLIITPRVVSDKRGFFYESYHRQKFAAAGITDTFVQDNHSQSQHGVLRGIHYQDDRAPMGKLVRCTHGRILDVAVDLRVGSPHFGRWVGVELSDINYQQLWVPHGFGHAFVVLSDVAEVQYKCTGLYTPEAEGTVRWDDPQLGIDWPISDPIISPRDADAPSLADYLERPAFVYRAAER